MTSVQENELVKQVKAGDEPAFSKIYQLYHARVYHFCLKLLQDTNAASEILQRVFVALWEQRRQIDETKPLGSYLFTIAKYMVYSEFKHSVYRKVAYDEVTENFQVSHETTRDEVLYNELVQVLKRIIDRLPEKRKEIFTLSRIDGLTYKEIAERLSISENTVDTQIRRALGFIRNEYDHYFL